MFKIKLIYNPASGRTNHTKTIDTLFSALRKRGHSVHRYPTTEKERADVQVGKFASDYDLIIACGGDGTANEVVNGMMRHKIEAPFTLFPLGTVNDFATHMLLPKQVEAFADMVSRGFIRPIDLGLAGDRYFLNVAAAGNLTDIAYDVPQKQKAALGRFAYYLKGLGELPKNLTTTHPIYVSFDGEKKELDCLFFLITNSPNVGGFKLLHRDAEVDDGYLHLLVIEEVKPVETLDLIGDFLSGRLTKHPRIHHHKAKTLRIEAPKEMVVDLDGEKDGVLPMTFSVREKALKMIVPKEKTPGQGS
jgi:diacylglycerol kinase (ATP)